jgi:ParB family chromosome partitioning protein
LEAYRSDELTLDQVQAFAVSDDKEAQERVFADVAGRHVHPTAIRNALTQGEIAATDKRARFITVAAYEEAGGAVRRDLFAEGDQGIFLLDSGLLERLVLEKLEAEAVNVRAEGWKWVEPRLEFGYDEQASFRQRHPEPLPMSEEAAAEHKRLAEEYQTLFESGDEDDEARSERLDEIESRIEELEDTDAAYTPETIAIAGAVVTIDAGGEIDIHRGLVRSEDEPEEEETSTGASPLKEKPPFSASLMESLTACRSLAMSASLIGQPRVALAGAVHALLCELTGILRGGSSLQLTLKLPRLKETCKGKEALDTATASWKERLPQEGSQLWSWCIGQDQDTLLELLAFCAAHSLDAVQRKGDRPEGARLTHAGALAEAVNLDMSEWFAPTKDNYFGRVGRSDIAAAITEATDTPKKRSWDKLKKSEFAAMAEREIAGTNWLPLPLRKAA